MFGNAPHHWFKPSGEGLLFALVFESDDDDAQPVAIEIVATQEAYAKLPDDVNFSLGRPHKTIKDSDGKIVIREHE